MNRLFFSGLLKANKPFLIESSKFEKNKNLPLSSFPFSIPQKWDTLRVSYLSMKGRAALAKPKKQRFELMDNETIDACLDRMKREGYFPVKRVEKPIFQEVISEGKTEYVPVSRQIIFEGKLIEQ